MKIMGRVKYAIKLVIVYGLYGLGLLQLWQRIVLRRRAVVLMYHRVLTEEEMKVTGSHPAIVVKRETFAAQMEVISKRFKVLTIDEFVERMERRIPFENSTCLVTFDDGWKDNYYNAFPILTRYRIPAVIFLPVNYIGEQRLFWQEALVHGLLAAIREVRKDPSKASILREIIATLDLEEVLDLAGVDPRHCIIELMTLKRKQFDPLDVDKVLSRIERELTINWDEASAIDGFLTWEQVAEMAKEGVRFGGHGAEHYLLSQLSLDEARKDIEECTSVLTSRLKEQPVSFSYPRGYRTSQVVEFVKQSGYRVAFIANGGSVRCDDDRFTVQRINIFEEDTKTVPLFLARIVGLF
ncbi:putative Polysaccharide deacetylase [Candidatus Nitrospira inopinata]|jgi:peptidoglycan/xylan/chitin deacetylase (PgdA/CDA1 family)|uniref:Putative Polysaccharide deacetylase n=2 Tax=Candidatus Nitrospira inopinata TaxID=1715989 RepID=A0A0S4L068_9BACT|nr:putative Polysaccharide deacetylase [Candidatus Nitrospira inopinata]